MAMPTSSPMSPVRTVKNAFSAARALGYSSHQCPISMNEHSPMISQPSRNMHRALGQHHGEHAGGEQRERREEVGVTPIAAHVLGRVQLDQQCDERHDDDEHRPTGRRRGCRW